MIFQLIEILLIIIFCEKQVLPQDYKSGVTLDVHEKIKSVKTDITGVTKNKQESVGADAQTDYNLDRRDFSLDDNKDLKKQQTTPVADSDKGGQKEELAVVEATVANKNNLEFSISPLRIKWKKVINNRRNVYFRRWAGVDSSLNHPVRQLHCMCLLALYLSNGDEGKNASLKTVGPHDDIVRRLVHLLSMDTTDEDQEEVYSILKQISLLPLRLFQWNEKAFGVLLNQIIPDPRNHNFRTLKAGVKKIFFNWHLDLGNASHLLREARIFRPPCIQTSEFSGSTKTSRAPIYAHTKKKGGKSKICYGDDFKCSDERNI